MIGVKLQGRLGNQLFQYAFAYATAKRLKTSFYFDDIIQPWLLPIYFKNVSHYFFWLDKFIFSIDGFRRFFNTYLKLGFYSKIKKIKAFKTIEISDLVNPKQEMLNISDNSYFIGYFQSENFFKEFKEELIAHFAIKRKFVDQFEAEFRKLPTAIKKIVVHVRRSDYISYNINLPVKYYHDAISSITEYGKFIFITDDPDFVKSEFSYISDIYISTETEIIDFQFLMNADICVISNSTFSWWGAYLNVKKAKIIAPSKWFPEDGQIKSPCDILQDSWNLIEV